MGKHGLEDYSSDSKVTTFRYVGCAVRAIDVPQSIFAMMDELRMLACRLCPSAFCLFLEMVIRASVFSLRLRVIVFYLTQKMQQYYENLAHLCPFQT